MDDQLNKYSIDTTDYQVGQDNVQKWGFDVHNPVFGISAFLVILFVVPYCLTLKWSGKHLPQLKMPLSINLIVTSC